jgi:hypothetical protein
MNDQKRRFRPRNQKNNFRSRNNNSSSRNNGHFQSNGNGSFHRNNGSMTNPFNVEKTMQKYAQLAKDALSAGDPVLYENYLQHAEHFGRRLSELNQKTKVSSPVQSSTVNNSSEKNTQETNQELKLSNGEEKK